LFTFSTAYAAASWLSRRAFRRIYLGPADAVHLPWPTRERLIYWFAFGIVIFFGDSVYNSKLGPRKIAGETGWSRALKIAGVIWIVFGSLGSILWLARYHTEYIPGPLGLVIGFAGFVLSWSLGALLNLVAQVSDHTHARHLMMESPSTAEK
jgi:hypothetical protein